MSPDEIIVKLSSVGVNLTRRTLLNYEKWELIPKAKRGGGGAGGKWTEYPDNTILEAYAAWTLMNGRYLEYIDEEDDMKAPLFSIEFTKYARRWNEDIKETRNFLETVEIIHKNAVKNASGKEKVIRLTSKTNRKILELVMEIWNMQIEKAKILLEDLHLPE